jgi:signal transduction histidine kinase
VDHAPLGSAARLWPIMPAAGADRLRDRREYFSGTGLGSILLMVVAGLLPWLLPCRSGCAWLDGGNSATVPVFVDGAGLPADDRGAAVAAVHGLLQLRVRDRLVAPPAGRGARGAAPPQRRAARHPRPAGESVRVNERTRISRELHDLLGTTSPR